MAYIESGEKGVKLKIIGFDGSFKRLSIEYILAID
ncbi:hypothetical protein MCY_00044 [Bartonella rattimassiliensis 15908]|uniref:Uncharacterized protein n=1 Tax=Bartonella rattimassiliensis 15908 TaxID=1094556 RepID=J0QQ13_9HYPH|nr:hypothetical protein MCY_00044 [Bartonella rattimassiliensis 15908]